MGKKSIITESARETICSELKLPFVQSVILIGSRARGDGYAGSDYDLYVVTPISVLPFVFPVMKKKEKNLREKLKADVSISPLTYSRMKRGLDTLVFHTKKEGVILCGENIKSKIKIDSVSDLPSDELFQYFFDALLYLIKSLNLNGNIDYNELIRNSAKSILYCANLRLMLKGTYSGSWKRVAELSSEDIVKRAYKIIKRKFKVKNPFYFWFLAREYTLETLQLLAKEKYGKKIKSLHEFEEFYITSSNRTGFFKTLQFLVLSLTCLDIFDPFLVYKIIVRGIPLDKYLHVLLLYAVTSVILDSNIDDIEKEIAEKDICRIIRVLKDNTPKEPQKIWEMGKELIEKYWQIACGKSVF